MEKNNNKFLHFRVRKIMQFVETPISKKNLDFRNVYNIKGLFKMVLTIWKTFIRQFIFFWQPITFFFFQRNLLIEDCLALSPFFINAKTWVLMQWQVFSFFLFCTFFEVRHFLFGRYQLTFFLSLFKAPLHQSGSSENR